MSPATVTLAITAPELLHLVANAMSVIMKTFRHSLILHMVQHALFVISASTGVDMVAPLQRVEWIAENQAAIESVAAASNSQALHCRSQPGISNDAGISGAGKSGCTRPLGPGKPFYGLDIKMDGSLR